MRRATLLTVLGLLRGRHGGPNLRVRALALVLILLLGGPLTLLVGRALLALLAHTH